MELRRLVVFIVFSISVLLLWQQWERYRHPELAQAPAAQTATTAGNEQAPAAAGQTAALPADAAALEKGERIKVTTDLFAAEVDTVGGDLRKLTLLQYGATHNPKQPFVLMQEGPDDIYIAQTGFMPDASKLPTHRTRFTAAAGEYTIPAGQDKLAVRLTAPAANGVTVHKILTFHRNSYLIDVTYEIDNASGKTISPRAYYKVVRDGKEPEQASRFQHTFTGAAVFTSQKKYQKVTFSDIDKQKDNFVNQCNNGWVGMVQHYFTTVWMPPKSAKADDEDCAKGADRHFELRKLDNGLYSMGTVVDIGAIATGTKKSYTVPLYTGPEEYNQMVKVDPSLVLTKDYGIFTIIAAPLFWLLVKLHALVSNWGWAIVLLTLLIKLVFFYPSAASYRSMAKMRDVAPRLERLKQQFGDDRQKLHQAMMELYKTEKINPLGGCLPMVIQIPVFIALYWVLLGSVELRQTPWMFWIHDLSQPDPFYILPVIMAISMWYQSTLNPAPADPMQAKMMKIMPLAFSVFFFFSPSGLVIYWLVNNLLSIAQQKLIYKQLGMSKKDAKK